MPSDVELDFQLLAVARVRLEDSPQALNAFVAEFKADTKQGSAWRDAYSRLKARHAADVLGVFDLSDAIVDFVDTWKKIYTALQEIDKPKTPTIAALDFVTPMRLSELSSRSIEEIHQDICHGRLTASLSVAPTEAEDHITRQRRAAGWEDDPFIKVDSRPRIVWLSVARANDLMRKKSAIIDEVEYPVVVDSTEDGQLKRYKKERVIFPEPYTATIDDLIFLDGDAAQYISQHTGRRLAEMHKDALPRTVGGGRYIIYRMLADESKDAASNSAPPAPPQEAESAPTSGPSLEAEKPKPLYKGPLQDAAILEALSTLRRKPGKMPPAKKGKGVRAEVWEMVKSNRSLFVSRDAFIHAWKRVNKQAKAKP